MIKKRLYNWHAAMFPTGRSGTRRITVADWRKDKNGPMQVVSGPIGKEKVHYEAPSAELLKNEMKHFLEWFNNDNHHAGNAEGIEPVIKSGLAHLWFVTIHPFDDGNGRIARAIADMQLGKAEKTSHDTALRDIQDLLSKGILQKEPRGGRSTSYSFNLDD